MLLYFALKSLLRFLYKIKTGGQASANFSTEGNVCLQEVDVNRGLFSYLCASHLKVKFQKFLAKKIHRLQTNVTSNKKSLITSYRKKNAYVIFIGVKSRQYKIYPKKLQTLSPILSAWTRESKQSSCKINFVRNSFSCNYTSLIRKKRTK